MASTDSDALAKKLRAAETRLDQLHAERATLEARLAAMEQALAAAREELTLVTVKLDILESAATILDERLRRAPAAGSA